MAPRTLVTAAFLLNSISGILAAEVPQYIPCPILRAYYPPLAIDPASDVFQALSVQFTALFDDLVQTGASEDFGVVTPNTTSFSAVLFSGSNAVTQSPVFFEYYYTAPESHSEQNLTSDTILPLGSLTQVFTVYAWLVEMGDSEWGSPVTKFIPELKSVAASADGLSVDWEQVTIGALAGHMAGLARDSHACELGSPCDQRAFVEAIASQAPLFLPDTTPIISNAAIQLLAFALQQNALNTTFPDIVAASVLQPLQMANSGFLHGNSTSQVFGHAINNCATGDPAALSMLSTTSDLARVGSAMLSSRLVNPASTRRWLQPTSSTSNLRNAVGRPWEIFHAPAISGTNVILDVYTKAGTGLPHYASYFGLSPDFDIGFAILAHDTVTKKVDLNVHADIMSLAVGALAGIAAREMIGRYAGQYGEGESLAVFTFSSEGPGLLVDMLKVGGVDMRVEIAKMLGVGFGNLDFRLYPSNVGTDSAQQFVAVFQDRNATVDQGTPTCITWQEVGEGGVLDRVVFQLGADGLATAVDFPSLKASLQKGE